MKQQTKTQAIELLALRMEQYNKSFNDLACVVRRQRRIKNGIVALVEKFGLHKALEKEFPGMSDTIMHK